MGFTTWFGWVDNVCQWFILEFTRVCSPCDHNCNTFHIYCWFVSTEIFNHMDETDSFDSDRKMLNVNKQMSSLQLNNNNNNNSVKLKPVVTKKPVAEVPALNGHRKLPSATKPKAAPLVVQRAATPISPVKKVGSYAFSLNITRDCTDISICINSR